MFYKVSSSPLGRLTVRQCHRTKRYVVVCKGTSSKNRKQETWKFDDKESALSFFAQLEKGDLSLLKQNSESMSRRLEDADKVIKQSSRGYSFPKTICLALAVVYKLSRGTAMKTVYTYENLAETLLPFNTLPNSNDVEVWVDKCLACILEAPGEKKLSKRTLSGRVQLYLRAIKTIEEYPVVFGVALAAKVGIARTRAKAYLSLMQKSAKKEGNHKPLSASEIRRLIESSPSPAVTIHLLKALASGLRPAEVYRLTEGMIENNRIRMDKLVTKVSTTAKPTASLLLLALMKWGCDFKLSTSDRAWIVRKSGYSPYRLRTTFATHQIYSGVDPGTVAEKLGHVDMTMVIKRYAKNRPPAAGDSIVDYYNNAEILVGDVQLSNILTAYETYLFSLLFEKLGEQLGSEKIRSTIMGLVSAKSERKPKPRLVV